jgi:hypothetical protein
LASLTLSTSLASLALLTSLASGLAMIHK